VVCPRCRIGGRYHRRRGRRSDVRTWQEPHRLCQGFVQEVRKVVWPTRKEATQTTLVVFGFVLVMAIFLWLSDKSIEWVIFSAILGWK
jgi:preprotein translocase SecE subunit